MARHITRFRLCGVLGVNLLAALLEPSHVRAQPPFRLPSARTPYAEKLNTTFILLRTKTPAEFITELCMDKGLCSQDGMCTSRLELALFSWLCGEKDPSFARSNCVKKNAKRLGFRPRTRVFREGKKFITTQAYLERHLGKDASPAYLTYVVAKIILQADSEAFPVSPALRRACCKAVPSLCAKQTPA
jgi:hypothetical protein